MITVDIQRNTSAINTSTIDSMPSDDHFKQWLSCCYQHLALEHTVEVSLSIIGVDEMTELNHQFRNINKPTNVLSFPAEFADELNIPLLGDIVICADIVESEAYEQKKIVESHWAHMTIHGMLHLLGYDHISDSDAQAMELLETTLIQTLGYPHPYDTILGADRIR